MQEPQIQSLGLLACVSLSDPPHSRSRQTLRSRLSLTFSLPVVCTIELSDVALPLHSWQRALALGSRCCPSAAHHMPGLLVLSFPVPLPGWCFCLSPNHVLLLTHLHCSQLRNCVFYFICQKIFFWPDVIYVPNPCTGKETGGFLEFTAFRKGLSSERMYLRGVLTLMT